jgi:two-component system phosphate regulon response regulator PhoB
MTPKAKILVVEDEKDILELVRYNLTREGYAVVGITSGEEALRAARKERPDLIILDLMLPGVDGLEVCKIVKNDPETRDLPIMMLTAKGEESDIVLGLGLGADDYVTKPFSPKVLMARVKALLTRIKRPAATDDTATLHAAGLSLDPDRLEVRIQGRPVDLTATEFRMLHLLMRKPGRVFARYQIVDAARGEDYPVTERSVDVHIVSLRKKLGELGKMIETVRGVGYRFRESDS